MQTFDVYLRKRLTEIDVIITQLVQRDTFTMFDWLYLDCSLDDIEIQKRLEADSMMFLHSDMDNILETVHEFVKNDLYLNGEIAFLSKTLIGVEAGLVLSASETDALEKSFTGGESYLEILVDALDCYIAHSFGSVEFDMFLSANQLNTFKYGMEVFDEIFELSSDIDFSSIKITNGFDNVMNIGIDPTNIFYMLTAGCRSTTYLSAKNVDEYTLAKVLYNACSELYLGLTAEKDFELTKYLDVQNALELITDITDVLIQLVESQSETYLDCEASIGLKRYRLLSEMDDLTLSDFDNMTLHEVDYVIIAE